MPSQIRTVSVIGAGDIGRPVLEFVEESAAFRRGRILTRNGKEDTSNIDTFLSSPCDLIIDCAGPRALKAYGLACIAAADVWTVGAAALADDALRLRLEEAANASGTTLHLFCPWVAGIAPVCSGEIKRLELHVCRPGLGTGWRGPLREAVSLFPNELNFAVAAALSGPGIDATLVQLDDKPQHAIEAVTYTSVGTFRSSLTLDLSGRHATAEAIIAALERWNQPVKYG